MSFEIIKTELISKCPQLDNDIDWVKQNAMLVINFTENNKNDVHIENPDRLGGPSRQTHIDLTSGQDIEFGYSPVIDFFPGVNQPELSQGEKRTYISRIHSGNVSIMGGDESKQMWFDDEITFLRLPNVNDGNNPKAQLTEMGNIKEIRLKLGFGTSLVLVRGNDGIYTALGIITTQQVIDTMIVNGIYKRKRMFIPETLINENVEPVQDIHGQVILDQPNDQEIDEVRKRLRGRSSNTKRTNITFTESQPRDGYVYIVTNPGFPGWVKVGRTTRDWEQRLSDYQTYAPSTFRYEMPIHIHVDDCIIIERRVLNALAAMDHNRESEWFQASIGTVEKIIEICRENL